jgi:hypothetical protein
VRDGASSGVPEVSMRWEAIHSMHTNEIEQGKGPYARSSDAPRLSIPLRRVKCAKFFGDHLACRNENKICHSYIAFVS